MSPSRHHPRHSPNSFLSIFFYLSFIICPSLAQTSTRATPASSTASPTIVPSTAVYTYLGCYNETTSIDAAGNLRALPDNTTASDSMTVNSCLSFCGAANYAGLQYTRECWCATNLNSNAARLPDANCSLPCMGDESEICGGALKLTVYERKTGASASGSGSVTRRDARSQFLELGCSISVLFILGTLVL